MGREAGGVMFGWRRDSDLTARHGHGSTATMDLRTARSLLQERHPDGPDAWSQAALARRLGVHPSAVSHWETGRRHPRGEMVSKIAWLSRVWLAQAGITSAGVAWSDWYETPGEGLE